MCLQFQMQKRKVRVSYLEVIKQVANNIWRI